MSNESNAFRIYRCNSGGLTGSIGVAEEEEEQAIGVIEDYDEEAGSFSLRSGAEFELFDDQKLGDLSPGDRAWIRFERREDKNIAVGVDPFEFDDAIGVIDELDSATRKFKLRSGAEFEVGAGEDFEEFFGPVAPGDMSRVTFERQNGANVARDVQPFEDFGDEFE